MSYSYGFRVKTLEEAKLEDAAQFEKVVGAHPIHNLDRKAVLAAHSALFDSVSAPDGKWIYVMASGYIHTIPAAGGEDITIKGVSASVYVSFVDPENAGVEF
jgi:hypothetical protein